MTKDKLLVAEEFQKDPRVEQGKKLLLDALNHYSRQITKISPPLPERKESYAELILRFEEKRGGSLFYPYIGSGIGNGCLVELLDGSVKYDFITGIGAHFLGHSHPLITEAVLNSGLVNTVMQGNLQQNEASIKLVNLLTHAANMDHCFLTTSGAMANENALKIALQKRSPSHRILAFEHTFSGRTLALSQITDKPNCREGLPSFLFVDYLPFFDPIAPEESTKNAVKALRMYLERHPGEYAAMIFELVQGENGFYPGNKEFFEALMQILKEHGVSIIVDEVQTFGRTPRLFAFQYFGLEQFADIVTIGKVSLVSATLFNADHLPKPGLLSQTFTSATSAILASHAVISTLLKGDFFGPTGKIIKIQNYFIDRLTVLEKKYPHLIQGPFGIGTMIAFTPYDGAREKVIRFAKALFDAGVITFIAGKDPARIRFLVPAEAVSEKEVEHVLQIVEHTLCEFV